MPAHSIFRLSDPVESLRLYAEIGQGDQPLRDMNVRLAALAAEDPVAFWLASIAAIPPGQANDPAQDPALRTDQTVALAEQMWGRLLPEDVQRIRRVHDRARDYLIDSYEISMKLAENWGQWFEAATFFDQIETISPRIPPITPRDSFDAWTGWAIIAQQISFALGYGGHRPPEPQGQPADAAAKLPYLFQREYDQSAVIARRFESSPVDTMLLMGWLYAPSLEVYLADGPLPETVPESVSLVSPRLAQAYAGLNTRQMADFAAAEEDMMQ